MLKYTTNLLSTTKLLELRSLQRPLILHSRTPQVLHQEPYLDSSHHVGSSKGHYLSPSVPSWDSWFLLSLPFPSNSYSVHSVGIWELIALFFLLNSPSELDWLYRAIEVINCSSAHLLRFLLQNTFSKLCNWHTRFHFLFCIVLLLFSSATNRMDEK